MSHKTNEISNMQYSNDADATLRIHFTIIKKACIPTIHVKIYEGDPRLLSPVALYNSINTKTIENQVNNPTHS